tara:strand:+ start:325 stop:660 length:336 start_codon:yes stop_codon:yes gene_type:complete
MPSRYKNRKIVKNNRMLYNEFFIERDVNYINHYETPKIPYLGAAERSQLNSIPHVWRLGDRYYKLADQYYDDPTYWWIVAWYNQRPLETDIGIGNIVYVPLPLDDVLVYFY